MDNADNVPSIRVALLVEYDGADFAGLQSQEGQPTIQACLEHAANALGAAACEFRASGRTDAGVHARGQVIALRIPASLRRKNLVGAFNWHLPQSIRVRCAVPADEDFDPRAAAIRRTYRYLLCAGQVFPPLMRGRMGRVRARLDLARMQEAAGLLSGRHDFAAWRSAQCQARRTRLNLERAQVLPWSGAAAHGCDAQCFEFEFACRSFLHRMVRYLVGGIGRAGSGALTLSALKRHLEAGTLPPRVAPVDACGLYLERVEYPPGKDPFARRP